MKWPYGGNTTYGDGAIVAIPDDNTYLYKCSKMILSRYK